MKNLLLCLLAAGLFTFRLKADDKIPAGAGAASMGLCSVSIIDFWSCINNQAGMAGYNKIAAGLYFENRYLQKELAHHTIAFIMPGRFGVFGINHTYQGFTGFNEQKTGLGYGMKLNSFLNAGIQLDYLSQKNAESVNRAGFATCEMGVLANINPKVRVAAHIFNPLGKKLRDIPGETAPVTYRFGISYRFSEKVNGCIESEKEMKFHPAIRAGLEIKVHEKAIVRTGFTTIPAANGNRNTPKASQLTFGFGTRVRKINLDIASSFHTILGNSFQVSMYFDIRTK